MRDRTRASLLLAVLAWGIAVAPAQAAPESLREVAKHRFEDGKHAFDAHDYATALRLFKAVVSLWRPIRRCCSTSRAAMRSWAC